jgi:hypothetical protein
MTVFALGSTVLLVCVGTCDTMGNTKFLKKRVEVTVFTTPIRLYMTDFLTKKAFYVGLKLQEDIKHIGLAV